MWGRYGEDVKMAGMRAVDRVEAFYTKLKRWHASARIASGVQHRCAKAIHETQWIL